LVGESTPTGAPILVALTNQPIALPRLADGKTSARIAMQLGGTIAPPISVSRRQAIMMLISERL
jgi:hypothetical protein